MSLRYKNGILVLNVLLIVMTLLSYSSPSVHPLDSGLIALSGLVFPLLILLNLLFIFYWVFSVKKNALFSGAILLIGIIPIMRLVTINSDGYTKEAIVVASFNCNFLKSVWAEKEDEAAQEACREFLRSLDKVDVFCLQEYGERSEALFEEAINYPYKYRFEGKTLAIYSRFPIRDSNMLDIKANDAHSCIWADIELPKMGLTRIYTVHMQSNRHDGIEVDTIIEGAPEKVDPVVMTGLLKHYQKFSAKRVEQAEIIMQHVSLVSHPYIVCGDMNDTPQSFMYQQFSTKMKDAFLESGRGFGFSYSGGIPFLRLDYVFVSQQMEVNTYRSLESEYSDHDLVEVSLSRK